jgi:3-oxoacyl-[acyl-carrier protein] reductase
MRTHQGPRGEKLGVGKCSFLLDIILDFSYIQLSRKSDLIIDHLFKTYNLVTIGRKMNSNRKIEPKVALVTGASRGIGRAIALELAGAGVTVCVNYCQRGKDAEAVVASIKNHGGRALALQADVSDRKAVDAMFGVIDEQLGRLDILVNNAAIGSRIDSITAIGDEAWRQTLAVNLDGTFFCLRAAIPRLKKAGCGRIVNISSGAALTGGTMGAHYAASKAGVLALTAKAARELAPHGISVNAVLPSIIETEMLDEIVKGAEARANLSKNFPIGRLGRPEEVAQVVRFLCLEAPDYLSGESIRLRGARL